METGGRDPRKCECIQLAAVVINVRTLELYKTPGGDYVHFNSLMRPLDFDAIEPEALRVNGKTIEQLLTAPLPQQVIQDFAKFVRRWNLGGKNDGFCSPLPAGHNIINFDMVIMERLCEQYKIQRKDGRQGIFNDRLHFDTMQMAHSWFWSVKEPKSISLDNLRDFFGISKDGAHDALKDVIDTAHILIKFMGLHESLVQKVKFKNCFGENPCKIGETVDKCENGSILR